VAVDVDRTGRGDVTLTLRLDPEALATLGLADASPDEVVARLETALTDAGWLPAGGGETVRNIASYREEDDGTRVIATTKRFDNTDQLAAIIDAPRDLRGIAVDPTVYDGLPDLPAAAPLLNEFTFRLGSGTGDNPGFNLFARGGVGQIGEQTCLGGRATGVSALLREGLALEYRFRLPGGPGETNAGETSGNEAVWALRYEDCPPLRADAGGGSSSTLVNGVILAALAGFLVVVFALRALRRRRAARHAGP
jgi:hypothetical protein